MVIVLVGLFFTILLMGLSYLVYFSRYTRR